MEKYIGWAGFAVTLIGFVWHAGRMAERIEGIRRDLEKFEKSMARELGELKALLYSTIGGRRAIHPIQPVEESGDESR